MEIVVVIQERQSLAVAGEQGAQAVAVRLPRNPDARAWSELGEWQSAAQNKSLKFYLIWDGLFPEEEFSRGAAGLAAVARLNPDGIQLRDLGLVREARRLYPYLPLMAAANWGVYNSPGLRLAESAGFARVMLDGPVSLKDLALMRRQNAMPLGVSLPTPCPGYSSLCLLNDYLDLSCEACCPAQGCISPQSLIKALETFSGLCQLGLEAVQINGELFAPASLGQVIHLFQSVVEASPMERPRVLAAARDVLEAFGKGMVKTQPHKEFSKGSPQQFSSQRRALRSEASGRNRIWVEARDYAEALALSRQWREPLMIFLTPDNYAAFLKDHRRWGPRRLIWRLPPAIRESSLAFYQKALETLAQGGYNRFMAGDWGAVALIQAVGGQIYGDQTLGIRNSFAVRAARPFGVSRVCLPPGSRPECWQELLQAAPPGSFWSYLYRMPPPALCPGEPPVLWSREELRWPSEDDKAALGLKNPLDLRGLGAWFKQHGIFPLIVALPHSPMPRDQLPAWLSPRSKTYQRGK